MLVSVKWLREYVDLDVSADDLAHRLTMAGLEVEAIHRPETLGGDTVLEIGVTPNRPDCLSIIGVAREAAVLTDKTVRYPDLSLDEKGGPIEDDADVIVHAPDLCPRYAARLIKGLKIGPSPKWLVERLQSFDQEPINNVVDVTNYVMMEYGQPLHAFDFNMLSLERIEVRPAHEGEKFVTLDEKEHTLEEGMLLICDGERSVALAGIMGGLNSEITDETVDVLIESAYFDPVSIRKTSKQLGISTGSSYRFERGVDPVGLINALDRAAQLMVEVAGGELLTGTIDRVAQIPTPREVSITLSDASSFLGVELDAREVEQILSGLGLEVTSEDGRFKVLPPSHRLDLQGPEDIYEEVARIMGYHRIPPALPGAPAAPPKRDEYALFKERVRGMMISMGFFETVTYSFVSPGSLRALNLSDDDPRLSSVRLMNPITEDQEVMRTTEAVGLLNAVSYNLNRKNDDLRLFELGRVFEPRRGEELPREPEVVGGAMCGLRAAAGWTLDPQPLDFYDIKGVVEGLAEGLGVPGLRFFADEIEPFLAAHHACSVYVGAEPVGYVGEVAPEVLAAFGIKVPVYLFEIRLEQLYKVRETPFYRALPRFPSVRRDLALVLGEEVPASRVLDELREAFTGVLTGRDVSISRMDIFDVYRGSQLAPGLKSLGIRLSFIGERSLTDEEVNDFVQDALSRVLPSIGAWLRE